ncbi:MAG: tRNA (adenine(9)-N1)-methyltransferase Trm10 [Thermoproteus sp.]
MGLAAGEARPDAMRSVEKSGLVGDVALAASQPLWVRFFEALRGLGVECLCVPRRFKCRGLLPQCVAVGILVGRYSICEAQCGGSSLGVWGGVELLSGIGDASCRWALARSCGRPIPIDFSPPEAPRIVVDLSLWGEHTEGEKHELVEQIVATLGVVRNFLWDGNLWITNAPDEFVSLLERHARGMVHKMKIVGGTPPFEAPVVLDPEGPCLFTEEMALAHSDFIIGGIVDKEHVVKSGTRRIAERIGVDKRCRIELRGSVVGVPDRINKIAEIILAVRFAGVSLEEAIINAQARRDKIYRLMRELQKMGPRVEMERARALAAWLKADERTLRTAAAKAHVELI